MRFRREKKLSRKKKSVMTCPSEVAKRARPKKGDCVRVVDNKE